MATKLDELRKSLLGAALPTLAPAPTQTRPVLSVKSLLAPGASAPGAPEIPPPEVKASSPQPQSNGEMQSVGEVAGAVDKLFEPARVCRERWSELAKSFDSLEHMTQWAATALAPMEALYERMRKLSETFDSMRAFERELAALASSFTPMQELHGGVAQIARSFHEQCAQMAQLFEPAKTCKRRMAELGSAFDAASDLQARFYDLSQKFRPLDNPSAR